MTSARMLAGIVLAAAVRVQTAGGDAEVLNDQTVCRFHVAHRAPAGKAMKASAPSKVRWVRWGDELDAPLPAPDWAQPDFDDGGWPRRGLPLFSLYGCSSKAQMALLCVRARFGVTDPARAQRLRLELVYRGGVVAYVNGREVARGHLPQGALEPLTPAATYPPEAFLMPDGAKLLPTLGRGEPRDDVKGRYAARVRRLAVNLPVGALRKGSNVLAVELHRAPTPPALLKLPRFEENWNTVGLASLRLTATSNGAVVPNTAAPPGVQVWNANPLLRAGIDVDYGDSQEPLGPIRLMAPRNGFASGQVVVSDPNGVKGVTARAGGLRSQAGAILPARAMRVRYPRPFEDRGFLALLDEPQETAKAHGIWLTATVPPDAEPGTYLGALTIEGLGKPLTVPVELRVFGWKLAEPCDWAIWVNLLQSPESVAGHYKVPLWSDEHFRLMERSFALMGECGNDILGITAVAKNVFGDDPLIVFRKQGGGYAPDFRFLERYLALYDKHAGAPKLLAVNVWSYGMSQRGFGRDGGDKEWVARTIPAHELQGDKLVPDELPMYGEPGSEELWRQVFTGIRDRVVRLGWREDCILLGTGGDNWPVPGIVEFFKKVAPGARWRVITHGSGCPKWGETDEQRTQPNGMVVGYVEMARRISGLRRSFPDGPATCNARDCLGSTDPFPFRSLPSCNMHAAFYGGFCWKGLDYWPYATPEGAKMSALNTYVRFGNMVGSTPRTLAAPGPRGAVATVQYEMLREGIQDCEAMSLIRAALDDNELRARLGAGLAARCERAIEDMLCMLETGARCGPQGGADVRRHVAALYAAAEEVARATRR